MAVQLKAKNKTAAQPAYEKAVRSLLQESPIAGLALFRTKGSQTFDRLGLPHRKLEAWRYIDLKPVFETPFQPYSIDSVPSVGLKEFHTLTMPEAAGSRIVFVNGFYAPLLSTVSKLPEGVVVTDLETALQKHADLVDRHLARQQDEENDAFSALNTALFHNGVFVHVKDGVQCDLPIQVMLLHTGDAKTPKAAYPRGLFIVGKQAKLDVIVEMVGVRETFYLSNLVLELVAQRDAQTSLTLVQNESPLALSFTTSKFWLEAGSKVSSNVFTLAGDTLRNNTIVNLQGEGAFFRQNGLNVLKGKTKVYNHSVVDHQVPNCNSFQVIKGILNDKTVSEFDGTVVVRENASGTDAQQLNKNLLLSADARVVARPQLRIDNDDVKCAHGATIGQLEEEELFYLKSRGISAEVAGCLLTYGFAEDVVRNIPHPSIRNYLDQVILHNLGHENSPISCFTTCDVCPDSPGHTH